MLSVKNLHNKAPINMLRVNFFTQKGPYVMRSIFTQKVPRVMH